MEFTDYQELAARTVNKGLSERDRLATAAMGIAGEAGEVADNIKKWFGHGHELHIEKLQKELGDVLWYVAEICSCIGLDLAEVALANVEKLRKRYTEGFSEEASRNRTVES